MHVYHTETISHNGTDYRVEYIHDADHDAPWDNDCATGIVSEWTSRAKRPGERVLCSNRFYDVQGTMRKAKAEGWNTAPYDVPGKAARAVDADFKRLRAWCNDEWHYMGVVVFPLTDDGDELRSQSQSLWGIESDCEDYIKEVTQELLEQITVAA